jgi:O-antigen/teichoic acid export membrane protein
MAPSAMSQFIEQLFRVIYMLLLTWIILILNNGRWQDAVVQSTFAAFIGAIAGLAVLVWVFYQQRDFFSNRVKNSVAPVHNISSRHLIWEVVSQAVPFVVVGSAIMIYQLIDQYTYFPIMRAFSKLTYTQMNAQYAIFDFNANKLIMIVISLAVAMGATAIPLLAAAHVRNDEDEISEQIRFMLELFAVVMIPAAIGMAAIAQPLYVTFYGYFNQMETTAGTYILQFSSFLGILFGLFTLLSTVTQGLSRNRQALKALGAGIILKLVLQLPALAVLGSIGTLVASFAGFALASVMIIRQLQESYDLKLPSIAGTLNTVIFASFAMGAVAFGITEGALSFMSHELRIVQVLIVIVAVVLGGGVYVYIILRSNIADHLFGTRAQSLRNKLHIRSK